MKPRMGIVPKLTLIFVLFAASLLTGLGALAYTSGRAALQSATTSELLSTAVEKQATLNTWVEERQYDVTALADFPHIVDEVTTLMAAEPDSAEAQAAYDHLVTDFVSRTGPAGEFLELMVIAPESGEVLVSTDPAEEGKFKENRPYFINGKSNPYVQNLYLSTTLQTPAMTAAAPIRSADGRLLAVLAGRLNLDEMNEIINRRTGLHQSDDAFLVNTSNLFVTQPRFISDPAVLQRGIHTEAVDKCLTFKSDGVISAKDYRGVPALIVYRWLPERQLCLIVKLDQAEAFAPSRALGRTIMIVSGVALLLASALAFWLAHTITRPVNKLVEGAEEIGQGNLEYRINAGSRDEIGRLANEFNHMAASLSEKDTQLHQRAEQLEAANKELEAFSYSVSHDLRAPLRAIDGFSRILMEEHAPQLGAEAQRYLQLVRNNTQQMGRLVDDLLAFSRLGRQSIKPQTVWPADLVRQALADLRSEQDGRKVEITIGNPKVDPKQALPACQADPALLKQVFVNLLSNALKFTRKRETARIEIGAKQTDGAWTYFVKDDGVGFDMRYVNKLFGVFQRLHRAEDYEGTGVGLAIVQRVIHRHGGRVWAEAEVDKGATFYFTLGRGVSND